MQTVMGKRVNEKAERERFKYQRRSSECAPVRTRPSAKEACGNERQPIRFLLTPLTVMSN